ncbi:asparagine synthase (glutamine-hydrolyzing) [Fulvivirgaceae bacterium BMA12]|uniref:asparagine synthase (glutamine-hydrolyzing) n=1 Tax=Agaribacillus aureus TaxID=3051825 RepID=A0ABT8LKI1_9BACT|nr:asparagine synthase (glutamine-hydrolyzing) [Fulvivirgaceae bacterium BMA12]
MCGISGIYNWESENQVDRNVLVEMTNTLYHRGPDDSAFYIHKNLGFGFRRLSIIDLINGKQPFFSPDRSVILICNGEIFNYKELRKELIAKGHVFTSDCDVEVILYLYLEYGVGLLNKLNGQFAFALFDANKQELFLARDHFGICPLFYSVSENAFLFGSEIKAILKYPYITKNVDLTGLDQVFSFPANVCPTTLFEGIKSLKPGHYAVVKNKQVRIEEYWDLEYPDKSQPTSTKPETYYVEQLEELLLQSVKYRLNADVPVGFYLSGGLDSSVIGSLIRHVQGESSRSFSICFPEKEDQGINERKFQRIMSGYLKSEHKEIEFNWLEIDKKLNDVIYFSEAPLKETYNVCSLALSDRVRQEKVKVILSGEGADELFGGYAGYKFDYQRSNTPTDKDLDHLLEDQIRQNLWGDPDFTYERNEYDFKDTKTSLYSNRLNELYESFDCLKQPAIDHSKIKGRHIFHQRSYVDFKLRLAGHLIADHGDRMTLANHVEGRYPFLDVNLVEFVKHLPTDMKLNGMIEKYILKQLAYKYVPEEIISREKFGFVAPGSSQLLKSNSEWVNDIMSYERIKRQGYFNPDNIERLKKLYRRDDFILNPPYDDDLLIIILTFNILLETFGLPSL